MQELNAAGDFNDVYVELLPIVQTLPQLLLHKDSIIKSLLSRVRIGALLSLEPILRLVLDIPMYVCLTTFRLPEYGMSPTAEQMF